MEKSQVLSILEVVDYFPNSILEKMIIKKTMGSISALSFDSGEAQQPKISPYDTFVQIIEGSAVVIVDEEVKVLLTGQCMIIPAHLSCSFKANERFKMIATVIKSGYDEVSLAE